MTPRRIIRMGFVVLLSASGLWSASTLNVQVRNGQMRTTPSFLGRIVQNVAYGSTVEILQKKGAWVQVKTSAGKTGWMHQSALTTRRIALAPAGTTAKSGASSDELALAGKGFNAQVEKEYQARNQKLDFAAVDRMEAIKVSPEDAQTFLKEGSVEPEGGAQ